MHILVECGIPNYPTASARRQALAVYLGVVTVLYYKSFVVYCDYLIFKWNKSYTCSVYLPSSQLIYVQALGDRCGFFELYIRNQILPESASFCT